VKRVLSLIMAIMMIITVTACSKESKEPAVGNQNQPEVVDQEPTESNENGI